MSEALLYPYFGALLEKPEFKLGLTLMSIGVKKLVCEDESFLDEIHECFKRFVHKDMGDRPLNKRGKPYSVQNGATVFGRYETSKGVIYIITQYDRSSTIIMLTEEY